jgi:hypothetical protein
MPPSISFIINHVYGPKSIFQLGHKALAMCVINLNDMRVALGCFNFFFNWNAHKTTIGNYIKVH